MVICGKCQTRNSPKANFCVKCRATLRSRAGLTETAPAAKEAPAVAVQTRAQKGVTAKLKRQFEEPQAAAPIEVAAGPAISSPSQEVQRQSKAGTAAGVDDFLPEGVSPAGEAKNTESPDVQPLLVEEALAKISQELSEPGKEAPLKLSVNFPRVLVAGYGSILEARLENSSAHSLDDIVLVLESSGLGDSVKIELPHIRAGDCRCEQVELSPAKGGNFVLRCNAEIIQTDETWAFRGSIPITINVVPDNPNLVVNISDIQCNRGTGANTGLGGDFAPVSISNVIPPGTIRNVNDLINARLPDSYGKVPLDLRYKVPRVAIEQHTVRDNTAWSIPKQFLAHVQSGTKLKLELVQNARQSDGSGEIAAIHLVARNQFKLGRSRTDADFLTWCWPDPNSEQNVVRTKAVTRVHAVAEAHDDKITLRDNQSSYGSTFEGHVLSEEILDQRGTLIFGHEYHLDVTPFPSTILGGLRISNVRTWSGPAEKEKAPARGSVRFMPINSEIALYNAVWIFTDANFGCSQLNPIVLDFPGAEQVEGRFSYFRKNFWIETLPTGSGVQVGGYKLKPLELVPIVNDAEIVIAGVTFRASVEP